MLIVHVTQKLLQRVGPPTANLFELPVYGQYGVGGPGFSGWRELAANRIVTDATSRRPARLSCCLVSWRVR